MNCYVHLYLPSTGICQSCGDQVSKPEKRPFLQRLLGMPEIYSIAHTPEAKALMPTFDDLAPEYQAKFKALGFTEERQG